MKIWFKNDGTYTEQAVNIPVMVNGTPIGFISSVTDEQIECEIWDMYVDEGFGGISYTGTKNYYSFGFKNQF